MPYQVYTNLSSSKLGLEISKCNCFNSIITLSWVNSMRFMRIHKCNFLKSRTIRNKYTYSTCASTACGVASASQGNYSGAASSNSTRAIFSLGCGFPCGLLAIRNKYTFSSCTSTACGVATASVKNRNNSAAGNSTRGIFALGKTQPPCCGVVSTTREKYTYASCSSTASGVGGASVASSDGSAASWATCVNT